MSRISMNGVTGGTGAMEVTQPKQGGKTNFGEKLQTGLSAGGQALAQGVSLAGGAVGLGGPAGVVSQAISSATTFTNGGATGNAYAASIGGMSAGGINTVGGGGGVQGAPAGGGMGGVNLTAGASTGNTGFNNNAIAGESANLQNMLNVQMQVQKENQVFTSISNVLKTKHDTVKNTISNVR
jgi:hypothetical protein